MEITPRCERGQDQNDDQNSTGHQSKQSVCRGCIACCGILPRQYRFRGSGEFIYCADALLIQLYSAGREYDACRYLC